MIHSPLRYTIGVDLGKLRNHSALAVLERRYHAATVEEFIRSGTRGYQGEERYTVIGSDRLALGTPYPRVVQWVKEVADQYRKDLGWIVVDATGVGSVVMDLFHQADLGVRPIGLTVTTEHTSGPGGTRVNPSGYQTVSRMDLLIKLQLAIQEKKFRVDTKKCREWDALRQELAGLSLEGKRRSGQDDLAFALALAVWQGLR